jgi:hypothetical protein
MLASADITAAWVVFSMAAPDFSKGRRPISPDRNDISRTMADIG